MACQLSSDPPSQDVAQQWTALQPCIAKHKWQYTWHMIWCCLMRHESNACILKHESHGQTKTNRFMNESMICVCQLKHLIPVSFTVMWQWPAFCWFHLFDPKTKAPVTMGLHLTELTRTGHEKGLDAHIFLCSVCTFSIPFAAWSDMTTSTRPHQQPELAGGSSEFIIKSKLWNLVSFFWTTSSYTCMTWLQSSDTVVVEC